MKDLSVQLRRLKKQSLHRSRRVLESAQGAEILLDGRRFLAFCSNDYLGLANHPAVIRALQAAAAKYGVGSGAAHLVIGHSVEHHALEEELADFTGRPRALLFSTGYMANMGVVSTLLAHGDTVYEDRLNHASLLDGGLLSGARLVRYAHASAEALKERMAARSGSGGEAMVLTDGVFSMDGDFAPLPELAEIAREQGAWMMVDDAHGFGVVGDQGKGTVASLGLGLDDVPIVVGTLGKAFGTSGAFVAGSEELIETLIQRARTYIFTTATPPALAAATRVSLWLARTEEWRRVRLRTLVERFRVGAAQLGLTLMNSHTPIQPVMVGDSGAALALADALREQGVVITPIRPPTVPAGSARLRVTFSAAHNEGHVDRLLGAFEAIGAGRSTMGGGCPFPETAERV